MTTEEMMEDYKPEVTSDAQIQKALDEGKGRAVFACVTIWETNHGYCVRDLVSRGSETKIFPKIDRWKAFRLTKKLS
jgi:hypothetical protein